METIMGTNKTDTLSGQWRTLRLGAFSQPLPHCHHADPVGTPPAENAQA